MDITQITEYSKNAKKHPDEQLKKLADIIKEVGWRQPVVVNQQGIIIVGHGRWQTWQKYNHILKPIWIIDDAGNTINGEPEKTPMTEEQEIVYRLADNKLNESAWDMDLVGEELKLLKDDEIKLTGFDKDDIHLFDEQEFKTQERLDLKKTVTCPACGHEF